MSVRARVEVQLDPPYTVHIGPGLLAEVREHLHPSARTALLADRRAAELHAAQLGLQRAARLDLEPGEGTKSFAVLERVLEFLASSALDRHSQIVALGGGVVGDLAGLAASLYMRGIAIVHCPTTLLAQVDAAVGGKTAVNLAAGKNLAGTFHQPRAVFADTATLATLDAGDFRSGLGELAKSALLDGEPALAELESAAGDLLARDPDALARAVERAVRLKARVVAADPLEASERKQLNLGHTFAHAIEHSAGYGAVPHGVAVSAGLSLALETSAELGVLEEASLRERLRALQRRLGLPASLHELRREYGLALDPGAIARSMRSDKKGRGGELRLVLVRRPGAIVWDVAAPESVLASVLSASSTAN